MCQLHFRLRHHCSGQIDVQIPHESEIAADGDLIPYLLELLQNFLGFSFGLHQIVDAVIGTLGLCNRIHYHLPDTRDGGIQLGSGRLFPERNLPEV